jgi:hypothetical protein
VLSNSRFVSDKFRVVLRSTHFAPQPGRYAAPKVQAQDWREQMSRANGPAR